MDDILKLEINQVETFLTRTLIQMRILLSYMRKYDILANRKPLMCIALAQTCLFHLPKHVFFGRMRGK